jgi:serine/threonine-protein kinase TTK/MPS1
MRRLGITGPPKRTMVTGESPSDWTVPQDVEMVIDQPLNSNNNEVSPLNSPTKTAMTMDKESMSLTTISPLMTHTDGGKKKDEDQTTLRSRAVRVNGKSYKVLQLIGRGGSSKVFKVLAPDNSILALKKVGLKNLDEVTLSGYLNEIDLLRTLSSSPHIIKLLDCEINKENSNLYMLMEYGEADLGKLLKRTQTENQLVDLNFIRYMWQQMLSAVQTVHNHKIVHCDLKPANFLLVAGRLKLIDFGISKAIMNDTTNIVRENQVGTVNYMSPEALQESSSSEKGRIKIGRASDVWSLGCILYEMSYGKPPFAQFTLIQRLHKILDSAYEIEFGPCDPILKEVIRSCLQRQSKKRLSLEELLVHPFLIPKSLSLPPDSVVVSRRQIVELMEKFARHIPQLDPAALTEKILTQWQRE